jgi:hypothetical protein
MSSDYFGNYQTHAAAEERVALTPNDGPYYQSAVYASNENQRNDEATMIIPAEEDARYPDSNFNLKPKGKFFNIPVKKTSINEEKANSSTSIDLEQREQRGFWNKVESFYQPVYHDKQGQPTEKVRYGNGRYSKGFFIFLHVVVIFIFCKVLHVLFLYMFLNYYCLHIFM